jgi:hypothetical protein
MRYPGPAIRHIAAANSGTKTTVSPPAAKQVQQSGLPQPKATVAVPAPTVPPEPAQPPTLKFGEAAPIILSDTLSGTIAGRADYTVNALVPYTWHHGMPENGRVAGAGCDDQGHLRLGGVQPG